MLSSMLALASFFAVTDLGVATEVESFAMFAGRLIGAAETCGAEGDPLASTAAAVFDLINELSADVQETARATELFAVHARLGTAAVAEGSVPCAAARAALSRLGRRLGAD